MSVDFRVAFCQATQSLCPDVQRVIWSNVLPHELKRERVVAAFAEMKSKIIELESAGKDDDADIYLDLLLGIPVYPPDGVDENKLRVQRRAEAFAGKASALKRWMWYRRNF